jgi:hypothetical protein
MTEIVLIIGAANGGATPHDNRFVVRWNPHTEYGVCEITTTDAIEDARRFAPGQALAEWKTVSRIEPRRSMDGKPNRPLSGLTIEVIKEAEPMSRRGAVKPTERTEQ